MKINLQVLQSICRYRRMICCIYNRCIYLTIITSGMYATHALTIGIAMVAAIYMPGKKIMKKKPWRYADSKDNYHRQRKNSKYGCIFYQSLKLSCKGRIFFVKAADKIIRVSTIRFSQPTKNLHQVSDAIDCSHQIPVQYILVAKHLRVYQICITFLLSSAVIHLHNSEQDSGRGE